MQTHELGISALDRDPVSQGTELVSVWTFEMMPVQFHLIFLLFEFNIATFMAVLYKYLSAQAIFSL